jgi:molybdopterin-containing oxidoreductase family molybdopterin binding subunit
MMVTGHIGSPGNGWVFGGYNSGWNINYAALGIPPYTQASGQVPLVCLNDVMETGEFDGEPYPIKSFLIWGKKVVGGQGDRQRLLSNLDKMDMVVSVDLEMTDTCQYADIVLPMAHFFEAEDVCSNGTPHLFNIYMEKAIDPLFECKHDFDAVMLLLKELGLDPGFTKEEFYHKMYDENDLNKAQGYTLETLQEKKVLKGVPSFLEDKNGNVVLGTGSTYNTATGRAQFYLEDPKPRAVTGLPFNPDDYRLPGWEPPFEASVDSELAAEYPFTLMTAHEKWRSHSAFALCEWLKELDPEPAVYINPEEAAKRSIENLDLVKVFNNRGYAVVRARYDNGMPPGLVNIPHGWRRDQFIEGHYNDLTQSRTHPFTVHNAFFDIRVQVEKFSS